MRTPLLVAMFGLLMLGSSGCVYHGHVSDDYAYPAGYYSSFDFYFPFYPWGWDGGHFHGDRFHDGHGRGGSSHGGHGGGHAGRR